MDILNWILFIFALIGIILTGLASYAQAAEEEDPHALLYNLLLLLTAGLVFYSTSNLFTPNVSLIIYRSILGAVLLFSLYNFYTIYNNSKNTASLIISAVICVLTLLNLCLSFFISVNSSKVDIADVKFNYTPSLPILEIILVVWIPIFILLYFYWKSRRNDILIKNNNHKEVEYNKFMIEDILEEIYYIFRENYPFRTNDSWRVFIDKAEYMLARSNMEDSELKYRIISNLRKLERRKIKSKNIPKYDFFEMLTAKQGYDYYTEDEYPSSRMNNSDYLLENITERIQYIFKQEFKNLERSSTPDYKCVLENLNIIKESIEQKKEFPTQPVIQEINYSHQQSFIKEIFHCLMTPISQIDASSIIIEESLPNKEPIVERSLNSIKAGIELCKSFLLAYRQLAFLTYNTQDEDHIDIAKGIISAELLYKEVNKKEIEFIHEHMPNSIIGYSGNFILAILLPLIENAICASTNKSKILLVATEEEDRWVFMMKNNSIKSVLKENLYKSGFSSKSKHLGTGLTIVRNLIANINNASLEFEVSENEVTTILTIPKNEKQL